MELARALVASDMNSVYLDFWPLVRAAWRRVVGIETTLVLIAEEEDVPDELRDDEGVVVFRPLPGFHTALQAQCIRLLFPALLESDGAILISDMDSIPLRRSYFVRPLSIVASDQFVCYRDVLLHKRMLPMWCNAARPETWQEIFEVSSLGDVRTHLLEWLQEAPYEGTHGGAGWFTDQQRLYDALIPWGNATRRLWIFPDSYCGFRRLDRLDIEREGGLSEARRRLLATCGYSDYHCLTPHSRHREVNETVLELAAAAARRSEC